MACILKISGTGFNVDEYLSKVVWDGYEVRTHHKGDKRGFFGRMGELEDSGFSICISEAAFEDFDAQQKDVISFLKMYEQNFELLKSYAIDYWHCLDFGLATYPSNSFSKTYILLPELTSLAGGLGLDIWMSHYFTKNERYLKRKQKKHWPIRK